MYEQYGHHGKDVWVRSDLKGKHREYCLCWSCNKFHPDRPIDNCTMAATLYNFCVRHNLVTPVWECLKFEYTSRKISS